MQLLKIGIVGGGFSGIITAIQLIQKAEIPLSVSIVNERETLCKGIAFNAYSDKHLLNVIAGKMSAFPDKPGNFIDWVLRQPGYNVMDRTLLANSFLPRRLYGQYLSELWAEYTELAMQKNIQITILDATVLDLELQDDFVSLWLDNDQHVSFNEVVIATGNHLPRNPAIADMNFYQSSNYFGDPWKQDAVRNVDEHYPVLIIGNGLTMVDTVLGLLESGYKHDIYSISPNGFNILPHRHNGLTYTKLTEELHDSMRLTELVALVHKHVKAVREFGVTAEPVIDSLRPHTQKFWQSFTDEEKLLFMKRFRHLWGVARHRIPLHTHDKLQQLRIEGRLHIVSGKLLNMTDREDAVLVEYNDKKHHQRKVLSVGRVINCTGPETDLMLMSNNFLKNCLLKNIISQDPLKLGIRADTQTYQVKNKEGFCAANVYTIGSNLKGELWESTAVNELRLQADKLAATILQKYISVKALTVLPQPV
jgi:uncharacterized NAD(P)/FAD-binding protein YdhS